MYLYGSVSSWIANYRARYDAISWNTGQCNSVLSLSFPFCLSHSWTVTCWESQKPAAGSIGSVSERSNAMNHLCYAHDDSSFLPGHACRWNCHCSDSDLALDDRVRATEWRRLFIRVYYDAILLCIAGGLILEMNILLSAGSNTFDLNYIWSICNWSAYVCNRCGYFILSKQRWLVKEPKRAFVSVHTQILALNTHWAHPQAPSNHSFINKLIAYSHE